MCVGKKIKYKRKKSKLTAVLLAVFFGHWTWVYTYRDDGWKLWISLVFVITTLGLGIIPVWIAAIIDTLRKPKEYYIHYYEL